MWFRRDTTMLIPRESRIMLLVTRYANMSHRAFTHTHIAMACLRAACLGG